MTATILLGDADPLSRRGWEALLRDQGYSVIAHRSGEDLLDSCPRVRPDLILINATSPDICGPEICRRLKADQRNRLTPVILITNLSDTSDSSSTSEISADDGWIRDWSDGSLYSWSHATIRTYLHILTECRNPPFRERRRTAYRSAHKFRAKAVWNVAFNVSMHSMEAEKQQK
jgi:DNA-binding response OmpR family regulator